MATIVGWRHIPPAAPPPFKYTSSCSEDQRLSTKGKIVSKYYNISKTPGWGSIHTPTPLYHGGGMNLHLRPRVNGSSNWVYFVVFVNWDFFKKKMINLFSRKALGTFEFLRDRSNVSLCSRKQNWILRIRQNRSTWRKTSRSKRENQQQTQPTYGAGKLGFEPTPHWREASALTTVSKWK